MSELSLRLGLQGEFFALPTSIHAAFGEPGRQTTFLMRLPPTGDVDLGRLGELDRLASDVAAHACSLAGARARLAGILDAPPRHRPLVVALAFAVVSAAAARILAGGAAEVGIAAVLGLGVGVVTLAAARPRPSSVLPPVLPAVAGLGASAAAGLAASAGLTPAPWSVCLAALIVLLPGLTLTLAMREVATGHLAAGSARLTGVASTFLALGCGIAVGDHLATSLAGHGALLVRVATATRLPPWTEPIAVVVAALAFTVLFSARVRDMPWIVLGSAVAWLGARLGAAWLDARLAPLLGALVLGVAGNLFARAADRPAAIVVVPGLLLLVPGSLGARSLSALLGGDVVGGVGTAFAMALVGASLVSGLLLANAIVAPRRAL